MVWYDYKPFTQEFERSGVYLLIFPNGKRYFGSSKNLNKRIRQHCCYLSSGKTNEVKWYAAARKDNYLTQSKWWDVLKDIKVIVCPCEYYREEEDRLLKSIPDRTMFYNSVYPKEG